MLVDGRNLLLSDFPILACVGPSPSAGQCHKACVFGDVGLAFAYCDGAGVPAFSVWMSPVPFSLEL